VILALLVLSGTIGYAMTYKDPANKKLRQPLLLGIFASVVAFLWPYVFGW
jgi:hypothetical protein